MNPRRPLCIATADSDLAARIRNAVESVSDAVGPVQEAGDLAALEALRGNFPGLLVVDPSMVSPQSVHEWTLGFLRESPGTLLFLLTWGDVADADALARFVGAQGAVGLPFQPDILAGLLASPFGAPRPPASAPAPTEELALQIESLFRGEGEVGDREKFLRQITDPETGLYSGIFWQHRLDEEFKRSWRFRYPLGLVGFSFEGEADGNTLLEVAGKILLDTRDIDVIGRYDSHTFLALLPHTGPAGTEHFARRVLHDFQESGLQDLLGEPLAWAHATAVSPDSAAPDADAFLGQVLGKLTGLPA